MKRVGLPAMRSHIRVDGPGRGVPLLFVNSLGSDLRIWDGVVAELATDRRCIRYDKRGHGQSDPDGPYDLGTQVADLFAVLDAVEVETAIVVGISVGGMIALQAALTRPDRVAALVLCDTATRIGSEASWNERIDQVQAHGLDHLASTLTERWFAPGFRERAPDAFQRYASMLAHTSHDGYLGTCVLLRDSDLSGRAGSIACPTLVVTGERDVSTPPEQGRRLAEAIPNGRFAEVAGAGHLPCVEAPGPLSRLVRDFLQDVAHG